MTRRFLLIFLLSLTTLIGVRHANTCDRSLSGDGEIVQSEGKPVSVQMVRTPLRQGWVIRLLGQKYSYAMLITNSSGSTRRVEITDRSVSLVFYETIKPDQEQVTRILSNFDYYERLPSENVRIGTITPNGNFSFGLIVGHLELDIDGNFVPDHLRQ